MFYQCYTYGAQALLIVAVISHAQNSVTPETASRMGAGTSLQASSVDDLAEDVTQYVIMKYGNKNLPADKANALSKEAVEKGAWTWGRTPITWLNP